VHKIRPLQERYESRVNEADTIDQAVRRDVAEMSRWSVVADFVIDVVKSIFGLVRDAIGWLIALVIATLIVSEAALWLKILFAVAVVVPILSLMLLEDSRSADFSDTQVSDPERALAELRRDELIGYAYFFILALMLIGLLSQPSRGLSIVEAFGVVGIATAATYVLVRLAHVILTRFWRIVSTLPVLLVFLASGVALWRYAELDDWPDWLRLGLRVGLLTGFLVAAFLATLQLALAMFLALHEYRKLSSHPEAEFVQSALFTVAHVDLSYPDADVGERRGIVEDIEYLARLLQYGVSRVLSDEDPRSAAVIAKELSRRAEALRARKRDVLFRLPGAVSELFAELCSDAVQGAQRRWLELAPFTGDESDLTPVLSRSRRVARVAARLLLVAVPVAIAILAWVGDAPALVPFATVWAVVGLIDLLTPGVSGRLSESASQAEALSNPLMNLLGGKRAS
jgi:hypothetical protein